MNNYSMIPEIFKKTLEPLRGIEKSISQLWNKTPSISYVEEGVYLPNIEINELDNEYHVNATIPGVEGKDIRIEYTKGTLILKGEKKTELEEDRSNFHISEKSSVYFNHTVSLPDDIDEDNISATLENGVIEVVLSKLTELDHKKSANDKEKTE